MLMAVTPRKPRNWHAKPYETSDGKLTDAISIGESYSFTRQVVMINPTERRFHRRAYVLWFGAYGWTRLHVYADSLDSALETCVDWIADYAPGLLADEEVHEEYRRLIDERVAEGADPDDDDVQQECQEEAEVDTTNVDEHYLHSWEWGIALEDPTASELYSYIIGD